MINKAHPTDADTTRQPIATNQTASKATPEFDLLETELNQAQRRRTIGVWVMTVLVFAAIVVAFIVFVYGAQTV